ncbi:MAG: M48 family metalloprotease [Paenibacillus macerans]|uniref:Peptidase M48 family protein n=1 Tax=Paenibacillus macerans TaxID=44252 RepID=A0A091A7I7_PAEMA|nr:M48 family metalloprotease [Paenibacillus macerans]KFN12196.1 peptidase M48 family protein [Paenibacillus macerans]MCY7561236.1 M48 family metalloprotease [Paenibacillus macerans]MDU7474377.1 M48 family metalloprotease [Paenibacillus macerans]MEC0150198.1 M48 family metalloprotease [Paenibacillus macerans]MEC0329484.1 M48 family metalloprotease [Paenibacillus macerans]
MGVIYSISFMFGNLFAYARLLSLAKLVVQKRDIQHLYSFLLILLSHLVPAIIVVMFFQSNVSIFYHLIMIAALVMTGNRWTKIWSEVLDKFEEQLDLNESEPPFNHTNINQRSIKEQFISRFKKQLILFINRILIVLFKRKLLIEKLMSETLLFPPNKRVVKIFMDTQEQLGMHGIELFITISSRSPGYAYLKPWFRKGRNAVVLTTEACEEFSDEELKALIAHELIHIKYKDYDFKSTLFSTSTIFLFIAGMLTYVYIVGIISAYLVYVALVLVLAIPVMMIVFLGMLIYLLYAKHGYWYQIREMRADRKACELIPEIRLGLIKLLKRMQNENMETNIPWYRKLPERYSRWHTHPSLDYRIHLLQNYKKWSYKEYIRHFFQTLKWAITGKGWSGD